MATYGYVYILVNEYMPGVYKLGCTERSPHERAKELSNLTAVPAPFKVLCYGEYPDFMAVERRAHAWLEALRISGNREFFQGYIWDAVRYLFWFPSRLSFVEPGGPFDENLFLHSAMADSPWDDHYSSPNPWDDTPKVEEPKPEEQKEDDKELERIGFEAFCDKEAANA